jgi:RNA methyltransferase, TrmH family
MILRSARRVIEGRHHPLVKELRGIVRSGDLFADGLVLLETVRMIEDALGSETRIAKVFINQRAAPAARAVLGRLGPDTAVFEVTPGVFDLLVSTETSQGILALAQAPQWRERDLFPSDSSLILVVAGVQDPGNLGAMIRTAEAFGATGILLTEGTVSPYNAKAVRATAGSLLRMPMLRDLSLAETLSMLTRNGAKLFTGVVEGGRPVSSISYTGRIAAAVGSEGAGLPEALARAGEQFTIPIAASVQSLNVAAATAVVLYEIARQRQTAENHRGTEAQR